MEKMQFGITMLVAGMGGTIISLWLLSLMITVLKKLFPREAETQPNGFNGK